MLLLRLAGDGASAGHVPLLELDEEARSVARQKLDAHAEVNPARSPSKNQVPQGPSLGGSGKTWRQQAQQALDDYDFEEARRCLEVALEAKHQGAAEMLLTLLVDTLGLDQDAWEVASWIDSKTQRSPALRRLLGTAAVRLGHLDAAERELGGLNERDGAPALVLLAQAWLARGREDRTGAWLDAARQADPTEPGIASLERALADRRAGARASEEQAAQRLLDDGKQEEATEAARVSMVVLEMGPWSAWRWGSRGLRPRRGSMVYRKATMGRRDAPKDSTPPIEDVASALEEIEGEGSFVARLACPSSSMTLRIEGVGPVPFPMPIAFARRLAAEASPAPYGKRDKTLLDPGVRDGWQIEASRVSVGGRSWTSTLARKLEEFQRLLGLPEEGSLEAQLDKLLLYGPGQFFAAHQDSERDDTMVASLVVVLPSRHQGGALVVEHAGQQEELRSAGASKDQLALFAFYADCRHEVKPVLSGYRVALTYHLFYRSERGKRARVKAPASALEECVRRHFATPVRRPYEGGPGVAPDKLVYLLDHEYTEKSLSWDRLKNADRSRASALLGVASRIPCEIFLALADVHESWNTEDDYYDRRYRDDHYYDEEDEDGNDEEEEEDGESEDGVVLLDLIDSDVELRHWLDREGNPVSTIAMSPLPSEVCSTLESSEFQPFRSEHEGNMGNYGNTADRWYHRAAIVLWPSDREYVIRAKVSPSWAIQQVASRLKAGKRGEAVAMVSSLSPFWGGVAGRVEGKPFTSSVIGVAALLEDSDLAEKLLAPLSASNLAPKAMPLLSSLIERHGVLWGRKVLSGWGVRRSYADTGWLQELPGVVGALSSGGEEGRQLSRWLVEREAEACSKSLSSELASPRLFHAGKLLDEVLPLLESASILGSKGVQHALVSLLARPEGGLPREHGGALLEKATEAHSPADVARLGLQPLYRQVLDELQRAVQSPARRQDDWSIQVKLRCGCDLCKPLRAFLESKTDVEKRWPLAKDKRAHIHHQIDAYRLPVSHVTERVGSPHVLVLRKQKKLFQDEAARRTRDQAMLDRLAKLSAFYAWE